MRIRTGFGALLLFALAAVPALADTKLEWNLKEGDQFYAQVTMATKQKMSILGMDVNEDMDQTTVASFKVLKKMEDGGYAIEQKIDSLKMEGGGMAAAFLGDFYKKFEGVTCKLVLDKDMQVTKVEDAEDIVKKVTEGLNLPLPPQFLATLVTAELQKPAQQVFGFKLPGKPVNKGDKWDFKSSMANTAMMFGSASSTDNYLFEGEEGGKAKISTESTMAFNQGDKNQSPIPISKLQFKAEKAKGTITFDPQGGRLLARDVNMKFKMSGVVSAMGQDLPVEMDFNMEAKTKVSDKPIEQK